jgi:hypothetical protein
MNGKLAVLVPAFEGGDLLLRTVASCLQSGLSRDRFSVIVVDNASGDPSLEALAPDVTVHRNATNLGRTGNWNRALELAEAAGFSYAAFLFVGDEWVPGGGVGELLDLMDANNSVFGMASLRIVDEHGSLLRAGSRVTIRGTSAQVDSNSLLQRSIGAGRLPFAPIQANIYRLFADRPLRFSVRPEDSLNCDLEGTVQFLQDHPGVVSIEAKPYLLWKERPGRFFTKQDPWSVFIETRRTLQRVSTVTGIRVNWRSANAIAMLAAIRETPKSIPWRTRVEFQWRTFRYLRCDAAGLSVWKMLSFVVRKVVFGKNYLDLSHEPAPSPYSQLPLHRVQEAGTSQ